MIADSNQPMGTHMKRQLIAGFGLSILAVAPAMAADMRPAPVYTKAPMMGAVFTWTGCYIGGNAGGLWATKNWTIDATAPPRAARTSAAGWRAARSAAIIRS